MLVCDRSGAKLCKQEAIKLELRLGIKSFEYFIRTASTSNRFNMKHLRTRSRIECQICAVAVLSSVTGWESLFHDVLYSISDGFMKPALARSGSAIQLLEIPSEPRFLHITRV